MSGLVGQFKHIISFHVPQIREMSVTPFQGLESHQTWSEVQLMFELRLSNVNVCIYLASSFDYEQLETDMEPSSSLIPGPSAVP